MTQTTDNGGPVVWQSYWRSAARAVKRALLGRLRMRVLSRTFVLAYEARASRHEDDLAQIAELSAGKRCIYDVGANMGITSLVMAVHASDDGVIYSFDASEACCLVIRENALLNGLASKIQVVNGLIADSEYAVHKFNWDFVSGNSSYVMPLISGPSIPFYKAAVSLDDFAKSTDTSPDLVKIDVEGAELNVLAGMKQILCESKPVLWIEFHSWPGVTLKSRVNEGLKFLSTYGYCPIDPRTSAPIDMSVSITGDGSHFARCHMLLCPVKCVQ